MKCKIKRIFCQNFKMFETLDLNLNDQNVVVLGGRNGYGKTTLFDIIELVITGKINRYVNYDTGLLDKRLTKSQEDLPLVHDTTVERVTVGIELQVEDRTYVIMREARSADIGMHFNFRAFAGADVEVLAEDGEWRTATPDELTMLDREGLKAGYQQLYYVGQEETLQYLKTKEKDRSLLLQDLIDTSIFDEKIAKLQAPLAIVERKKEEIGTGLEKIKVRISEIDQLRLSPTECTYERLAPEKVLPWDDENPAAQQVNFPALLGENGVMDQLAYFAQNRTAYQTFKMNSVLRQMTNNRVVALILFMEVRKNIVGRFRQYLTGMIKPVSQLSIGNISRFSPVFAPEWVETNRELAVALAEQLEGLKLAIAGLAATDKVYGEIEEKRQQMQQLLQQQDVGDLTSRCPLCGHDYEEAQNLLQAILAEAQRHRDDTDALRNKVVEMLGGYKNHLTDWIITPTLEHYRQHGVTEELLSQYDEITDQERQLWTSRNNNSFHIDVSRAETVDEVVGMITAYAQSHILPEDEQLDYQRLEQIHLSFASDIPAESLTIEKIERKRQYLVNNWNTANSEERKRLVKELASIQQSQKKCGTLQQQLKNAVADIEEARKRYYEKVIHDIEILFYVYSGRIMQDSFYGRGLFMKYDRSRQFVNFTTNPKSDVDALFNLSSGQLVALVLAFVLSLNKLYHQHNLLLIDDPIQTIDDINTWGFIETLRHEFPGYFFLFSTHEQRYGSLLRYKMSKFGFAAQYRDLFVEGDRN